MTIYLAASWYMVPALKWMQKNRNWSRWQVKLCKERAKGMTQKYMQPRHLSKMSWESVKYCVEGKERQEINVILEHQEKGGGIIREKNRKGWRRQKKRGKGTGWEEENIYVAALPSIFTWAGFRRILWDKFWMYWVLKLVELPEMVSIRATDKKTGRSSLQQFLIKKVITIKTSNLYWTYTPSQLPC